jgi:hypothetical protein
MQLIFVTDIGESYTLDVDPNMEMENIMALLEAEVREGAKLPPAYAESCQTVDIVDLLSLVYQSRNRVSPTMDENFLNPRSRSRKSGCASMP